jgi:hypothetical protein
MAEISDWDIQATALLVNMQHGASACYYAASCADQLQEQGARAGGLAWRKIFAVIERLQTMEPEEPLN